ncbi:TetR/AcrR family transcriptional regulator [Gracilibacillus alcaliphilus]|uniref:TetR/AcrR family transcriptional regulator n=1 Tax=Gracilibacillus alcaliphilus TaxID=1401441 RepID=UPI001EF8FE0B|nr:TetR/AcrR family transcriptional regulator [Gracilibacillus alcaliphilus]MBM7679254.1 AcrR family transcriptional regulator [Gracilibacillus alcaliphilus]
MSTNTRELLLDVALELFATEGYHATKVSDIVKHAGVAQGTFYWHFQSKSEIALTIIEDGREKLLEVVRKGYRRESGYISDMLQSSKHLVKQLLIFGNNHRHLMILLLLKGHGGDEHLRKAIAETIVAMETEFANNIQRAIDLNMLEDRDCVDLQAQILTSFITGIMSRWLFGPLNKLDYTPNTSIDDITEEIVRYEFFGLVGSGGKI